ncbi:hypothetical protein MLD52_12235 [Puniceicoccaceae bacterium K14]|nr:hypothetical protein [Puniceicoccaceae bacterium K14]
MKTQIKSNKIASIILAAAPIVPIALLLPTGEVVAGLVVAALAGLGYLELKDGAAAAMPRRQPRGSIQLYRQTKSEA